MSTPRHGSRSWRVAERRQAVPGLAKRRSAMTACTFCPSRNRSPSRLDFVQDVQDRSQQRARRSLRAATAPTDPQLVHAPHAHLLDRPRTESTPEPKPKRCDAQAGTGPAIAHTKK
jgi:hypothetical protein